MPAHDTFERVVATLDSAAFERCCLAWLWETANVLGVGQVAIDGKTLRGSANSQLAPLHLVNAWATEARLVLGQVPVDAKSNEITAIPELLALLDLKGALVTIDAMGCQKQIAKTSRSTGQVCGPLPADEGISLEFFREGRDGTPCMRQFAPNDFAPEAKRLLEDLQRLTRLCPDEENLWAMQASKGTKRIKRDASA